MNVANGLGSDSNSLEMSEVQNKNISNNRDNSASDNISGVYDGKPETREITRSKMAMLFVMGFFSILFLCFVYAAVTGAKLSELKDTLIALIGALSGTLGLIVGYYYKSIKEI